MQYIPFFNVYFGFQDMHFVKIEIKEELVGLRGSDAEPSRKNGIFITRWIDNGTGPADLQRYYLL